MDTEQIRLKFLGSGDAFSSGGRFKTCFHITASDFTFLIDCGATSLTALMQAKLAPEAIDAILLTHFHGDHFGGIPFILLQAQYIQKRTRKLIIAGPEGVRTKIKRLLGLLYPGIRYQDFSYKIEFIEYKSHQAVKVGSLEVIAIPVIHSAEASPHGLRISLKSKIVTFSGDSAWTDNLVALAKDADLFICECNFYETSTKGHLNYQQLLEHKHKFTAKRLILNHFDAEMLQRLDQIEIETAHDGMEIIL